MALFMVFPKNRSPVSGRKYIKTIGHRNFRISLLVVQKVL